MLSCRFAIERPDLNVGDYRCSIAADDVSRAEWHPRYCMALVGEGSFTVDALGRTIELTPGSIFVGYPGDDFTCHHDHHHGGDRCLSFDFTEAWVEEAGAQVSVWRSVGVPATAELSVTSALVEAAARGQTAVGLEEAGYAFAARLVDLVKGERRPRFRASPSDRRRATDAALWIQANRGETISLAAGAAKAGLSPFHFLRVFRAVHGITPHQFLIASRLREAAATLIATDASVTSVALQSGFADLSNFVRTFGRVAGMTPTRFRGSSRENRKIVQAALDAAALTSSDAAGTLFSHCRH